MTPDLRGAEAERTVPAAVQGVLILLRERGHQVEVRRSGRNGSWYYSVDGAAEVRGGQLCRRFDKDFWPRPIFGLDL